MQNHIRNVTEGQTILVKKLVLCPHQVLAQPITLSSQTPLNERRSATQTSLAWSHAGGFSTEFGPCSFIRVHRSKTNKLSACISHIEETEAGAVLSRINSALSLSVAPPSARGRVADLRRSHTTYFPAFPPSANLGRCSTTVAAAAAI